MNEISIGAVGAAVIAGLVSMLGLIISKEQKISEFRQVWIDDLRRCVVDYLVSINAICDILSVKKAGKDVGDEGLLENYKLLNKASHGIALRINSDEKPAKALLASMKEFEEIAKDNTSITPEKIRVVEDRFTKAAKGLLKFEWKRVKKGEKIFIWTKRIIVLFLVILFGILVFAWYDNTNQSVQENDEKFKIFLASVVDWIGIHFGLGRE